MLLHRRTTIVTTALIQCAVITFLASTISCVKVKGDDDYNGGFGEDSGVVIRIPTLELNQLEVTNFLVGISAEGIRLSNSTRSQCVRELDVFLTDVAGHERWALKVIDSFGVAPRSFSWGNYFWFTAKEMCEDLNKPYRISLSNRYRQTNHFNVTSPFPVRFWMVYFNFSAPVQVDLNLQFESKIHAGLCLPKSCTRDEVTLFSESYFSKNIFETQQRFGIQMKEIDVKAPMLKWDVFLKPGFLMCFGFLISTAILIIIAEVIYRVHKGHAINKDNKMPLDDFSRVEQFFLCFDLSDNCKRLIQLEGSKGFLPAIAGFRTIVCLWVTLFHVYFYSLFAINNVPLIFAKLESMILQPVLQSCFYVDVFFVISSFLLVFNFLSNSRNINDIKRNSLSENVKFFLKLVFHRYVRLLPIMLITMMLSDCMFDFLDVYSPFQMNRYTGLYCKENWWYNILFINNFLDLKEICSSWTWYLGCEMQFFILFTMMLFIYAKNESMGKGVFTFLLGSSLIISFLCNYFNGITFQIDVIYGTLEQLYVKPWVRINPYFAGALVGWLFYKHREEKIQFKMPWKVLFWTFTFCLYCVTNIMSYWRNTPTWVVATIMSLGKLIFGLCIGCVIVMCEWGHGGALNRIMSSNVFLFMNKFSYSIYMVAPVIIVTNFGLRTEATHFSEVSSGIDFIAVIVLSIIMSFIVVLLVEIPVQKISSRFILRKKVK